jgi:hypothetical protein
MTSKGWQSKGDKSGRRSPRQRGGQCARPFKAPRSVTKDKGNKEDSEIQEITGTENARDIEGDKKKNHMLFLSLKESK